MFGFLDRLRNISIAFNGIALSLITLAQIYFMLSLNLLASLCQVLAIVIFVIKLLKYIFHRDILFNELDNYINGGYIPLFTMFIAALSTYVYKFNEVIGGIVWYIAFVTHLALIFYLYYSHNQQKNLSLILPNWFIPPIGFVAIGLAAKSINANIIANWIFLFSDLVIIPLSITVIYRQISKPLNSIEIYTTGIYAAPLSLLMLAMMKDTGLPFHEFQLMILFYINILFNIFSCIGLLLCLRKKECIPCFACFTFPFAVSALANMKYAKINPTALPIFYAILSISSIMTIYTVAIIINQRVHQNSKS